LQAIAERVLAGKKVYVKELAREFGVSPSSIRIDEESSRRNHLLRRASCCTSPKRTQSDAPPRR